MRVFIAIDLPDDVKNRLLEVEKPFEGRGATMVKGSALHVTMEFLGELDQEAVEEAKSALSEVEFPAYEMSVNGLSCFTPQYIKVIFAKVAQGYEESIDLHRIIAGKLVEHGLKVETEDYVPHVTIARVKSMVNKFKLLELIEKYEEYEFGSFSVKSVSLKKSVLGREGPEYSELYKLEL